MEASEIGATLATLVAGRDLRQAQAKAVFDAIMAGKLTGAQIAAVLVALKAKGESVPEIAGAAQAMRAASTKVRPLLSALVDTCGTAAAVLPNSSISPPPRPSLLPPLAQSWRSTAIAPPLARAAARMCLKRPVRASI